jgi:phosphoglycolate phosphatase
MNFPLPVKAVTIDLDGTLLDTIPDLAAAANRMLAELRRPALDLPKVASFVGKGIPNLVKRCLEQVAPPTAHEHEAAVAVFRRHYAAVNGRETAIFPGVREGLDMLRALGLPLGCVTNKAGDFTEPLLRHVGLRDYFGIVVSGDTLAEKKPHPLPLLHIFAHFGVAPAAGLHIGDSVTDVQAARAAGCKVFCVPYGYNEGADVRTLDCDAIVSRLDEAARLLSRAI